MEEVAFCCPKQSNPQDFQIFAVEELMNVDEDLQAFLYLGLYYHAVEDHEMQDFLVEH